MPPNPWLGTHYALNSCLFSADSYLSIHSVVDVGGPQPGCQQQQLKCHEVHRNEQQRPAVRQRLYNRYLVEQNAVALGPGLQSSLRIAEAGDMRGQGTCMMPSRGWKARPAKGLSASCLLYWWCMWCSDLQPHNQPWHRKP